MGMVRRHNQGMRHVGGGGRRIAQGAPASVTVTRIASREFGPGHSTGTVASTSNGSTVNRTVTCVNESGAPITLASLVFAGWGISNAAVVDLANDVPVSGVIEYPSGVQVGDFGTTTVPAGGSIESARVTLSAAIPDGATFRVLLSLTIPNGQQYGNTYLGLCGVNSTTTDIVRVPEALYVIGDSIQTDNSSAMMSAATGRCPLFQHSVASTRANMYSATFAAKHVALAKLMGITRFVSDFGTNDLASLGTAAAVHAHLTTMRNAAAAEGIKFSQSTITPRVSAASISVTSATVSGTTLSLVVASRIGDFAVGQPYVVSGATETLYNGTKFCTGVNVGTNTVTFDIRTGAPASSTGTIVVGPTYFTSSPTMQTPHSINAERLLLNSWIRNPANIDDFIEWADACEPSRDAGRWKVPGEDAVLQANRDITVSGIISTTRFNYTSPDGAFAANVPTSGLLQWKTGANLGHTQSISSSGATDITVSAVPSGGAIAVGDTARVIGGNAYPSTDGLHVKAAVSTFGGQRLLVNENIEWLEALL